MHVGTYYYTSTAASYVQLYSESVRRHAAVYCVYVYTHTACAYTAVYTCVLEYTVRVAVLAIYSGILNLVASTE
jgi:hypothetical protein